MLPLAARAASAQSVDRDVPYVVDARPEQHLDFHWPPGAPSASVLFVHGGSLEESGERRTSALYAGVCEPFVRAEIACATTDYRLSPSFRWPTMALDVAAAVRAVRDRTADRGGDPDRVFLFGHSSGCHLVAILGTNPEYLTSVQLGPSDVAGIIPMGCTLDKYDAALRGLSADGIRDVFDRSGEVEMYGTAEGWISANPAHWIGPDVPPALVIVARAERFFPSILEQGARFVRLLKENDVPADLVIVPGTHLSSIEDLGKPGDPTFAAIRAFVEDPVAATSGGAEARTRSVRSCMRTTLWTARIDII
jgi:acetyl esterase/lipase